MVRAAVGTITSHIVLCPLLPDWAAKAALVEISAYAVTNYAKGRHWRLAALEVLQLCQAELIRTLGPAELWHLGMSIAKWAPKWVMSRLGPFRWVAKIWAPERPLFSDMDPAFGVDLSPGARRGQQRAIIQRLSHLDAVLAKTIGSSDERAHSRYTAPSRSGSQAPAKATNDGI